MAVANLVTLVNNIKKTVSALQQKFNDYQPKNENTLLTNDKTIAGGINENKDNIDSINETLANKVDNQTLTENYYNKTDIDSKLSTTFTRQIIESFDALPPTGQDNIIYLVKDAENDNYYAEYLWNAEKSEYDKIGDTKVDLTDYYNKTQIDAFLQAKQTSIDENKTVIETLKNKINEIITTNTTKGIVTVGEDDDGLNFTISAFEGISSNRITIYAMGVILVENTHYTINNTNLILNEPLEQGQYINYEINNIQTI